MQPMRVLRRARTLTWGAWLLVATAALAQAPSAPPPPKTQVQVQSPNASGAPAAPQTADEAFKTRVKTLEEQVADLKEKIVRTRSRLVLLQETVLGGDLSTGARAVLYHRNEMSSSFTLESVAYALDGAPIFTKVDTNGDLASREELEIFNGRIVPGQHQIAVKHVYRLNGFGVFSYLDGYKITVNSASTFTAEGGKVTTVRIVGFEKGGLTTEMTEKAAVRYDTSTAKDLPVSKSSTTSGAPPAQGEKTQ